MGTEATIVMAETDTKNIRRALRPFRMSFGLRRSWPCQATKHTTFLAPLPSVLNGMARLVDLGAQLDSYNESLTTEQADTLALANDWFAAGCDLKDSFYEALVDFFLHSEEGQAAIKEYLEKQLDRSAPR